MRCVIPSDARNPGSLFRADAKTSERNVSDLVLVVDDDGDAGQEVRPVSGSWVVESVVHGAVGGEYAEWEHEVIVGADDAVLVHGGVARGDVLLDDFFGFFLEVVEGVGIEIVVCPTCNHETDVLGGVIIEVVTFLVLLVPADGIKGRRVVRERGLAAAEVDVEAGLFGTDVVRVRVHEFFGADKLLTHGASLPYAVSGFAIDGIRFVFPVGEGCFAAGLGVIAFAVADDEHCLFVATDALEYVGDVGKADGIEGDCGNRRFDASRVSFGCGSRRA